MISFTLSGAALKQEIGGPIVGSGYSYIINPDTLQLVTVIPNSGVSVSFTGAVDHTTKSGYFVTADGLGYEAEGRIINFPCPTDEVGFFKTVAGNCLAADPNQGRALTQVLYENFEGALDPNLWAVSYSGSATISGRYFDASLSGSYWWALRTSGSTNSYVTLTPVIPEASGINCGRMTALVRAPSYSSAYAGAGFRFFRQSSTSNGWMRAFITSESTYSKYGYGMQTTAGYDFYSVSYPNLFASAKFPLAADLTAHRKKWLFVDFNSLDGTYATSISGALLLTVGMKEWEAGDDVHTVKNSIYPFWKILDLHPYTQDRSFAPAWEMGASRSNDDSTVGFDEILLEKTDAPARGGWFDMFTVTAATTSRPIYNAEVMINNQTDTTGHPYIWPNDYNWLLPGLLGPAYTVLLGTTGDYTRWACLHKFKSPDAAGIKKGAFRIALSLYNNYNTTNERCGVLFYFMGQGADPTSTNSYVLAIHNDGSGANRSWLRLYKGSPITAITTASATDNYSATPLLAQYNILGPAGEHNRNWIEVRWRADPVQGAVKIEVYRKLITGTGGADTSPGNVDYGFTKVIDYTDVSNPYLTTTEPCYLMMTGQAAFQPLVYDVELRRSKY